MGRGRPRTVGGDGMIKLLHVEDDGDIREIAKMSLEMSGEFDLTQCSDGEEALRVAPGLPVDVLLLDLMMPGMTGKEVLAALRQMPDFAQTPAIFMTARVQESDKAELMSLGAVSVIPKPFDPMTLGDQIKAAISVS